MQSILIVDDESKLRQLLARILQLEGYHILEAEDIRSALAVLERQEVSLVLSDVKLPDGDGVDLVLHIKTRYPATEIIVLTAYGTIADGVRAIKNGAFDYLTKGDDNDKIIPLVSRAMDKAQLQQRIKNLEERVEQRYSFDSIIGESPLIRKATMLARKVAITEATVLLLGETGTGKEVFAQAIHQESARKNKTFVAVNCGAFSKDILASELFGHKAGSFTGATKDKKGLFEEANGGTLFLDEIGEMNMELQSQLLRVLESGEFIKVGDTKVQKVNVRIIAATNRNLEKEIEEGKFREDLFYRLSVFQISLPTLKDRKEDIPLLAAFYLQQFNRKNHTRVKEIDPDFLKQISNYNWKGNVRELKNLLERAIILAEGDRLTVDLLPGDLQENDSSAMDLASVEKKHIRKILQQTQGNKTEAARILGIGLTTLYRKIEEYELG